MLNRMLGRTGDSAQANKLMTLGLFADVPASHWAAPTIAEAAVQHTPVDNGSGETWTGVDLTQMTFQAGVHQVDGQLYYVDRDGNLAVNQVVGAYTAGSDGALVQTATSYQLPYVPYISQIDNIYAWVGCEAVSTLMGLQAKGYATDVSVKYFLDNLPRHSSNPEKGFVGSPYVPDTSKRTRTTIYPAKLAEYSNSYCNGDVVCADSGGLITDLQRELLGGQLRGGLHDPVVGSAVLPVLQHRGHHPAPGEATTTRCWSTANDGKGVLDPPPSNHQKTGGANQNRGERPPRRAGGNERGDRRGGCAARPATPPPPTRKKTRGADFNSDKELIYLSTVS